MHLSFVSHAPYAGIGPLTANTLNSRPVHRFLTFGSIGMKTERRDKKQYCTCLMKGLFLFYFNVL